MKTKKNPVYLFERLGKYIGISTVTGDFYDLSQEAYLALEKWSKKVSSSDSSLSDKDIYLIAKKLSIPDEILKLFPPFSDKDVAEGDRKAGESITDLTLNLTSKCNLNCVYCWNDQGKYSNNDFQKESTISKTNTSNIPTEMSPETACKAVDLLLKNRGDEQQLVVDFYGGEPLENLETLRKVVDYCKKKEQEHKVSIHYLLATNGTLLTPALAEELIDKGVQIAVSIDGPKTIHDKNRPFHNGAGSFKKITSNLQKMPEPLMKRLVGRTTVTPFYADMVSLYDNLRGLGFERIELFESEDACHKITPQREKIFFNTDEQYQLLFKEYERLALKYIDEILKGQLDYKKTFFNRFFKLMQRLYYNHEVTGGCPAAQGQVAVGADGKIYPCTSFLGIKNFTLGNVSKGFDQKKYTLFVEKLKNRFNFCRDDCSLFSICRTTGSCLNINYYFNRDMCKPYERSCMLFTEKLKLGIASLSILLDKISPDEVEKLFGYDPVGRRGNELY